MKLLRLIVSIVVVFSAADVPGAGADDFLAQHCAGCHFGDDATLVNLQLLDRSAINSPSVSDANAIDVELWEKVLRRLRTRQMPPPDADRPTEAEYVSFLNDVENRLDERAARDPQPGRTDPVRRLSRTEYGNAVRDLLSVDIRPADFFPADQEGHGFDNVTLAELSPVLLQRYITAAEKIASKAMGRVGESPAGRTVRLPADRSQDSHVTGLPLGTRGGTVFEHVFPQGGDYEIQLRLMRDRDEKIEGLHEDCEVDVLIDRKRQHRFRVEAPKRSGKWGPDFTLVDAHLKKRIHVEAGRHRVGVTFPMKSSSLQEIRREPFETSFNLHRHPRREPAIFEVSIVGPFDPQGPGDTLSRRRIFGSLMSSRRTVGNAEQILRRMLRLAYRRPITDGDLAVPMKFFARRFQADGFDAGLEAAIASVLVNPHFLLRVERDPTADEGVHRVSDLELASRLSFFLWSSIPDDSLLTAAEEGLLHKDETLRLQVQRMLNDPRSQNLVTNFASQWLYLRNLGSVKPDRRRFPDFDDNLRNAMRRETELLFESVIREDRSVLDLIRTDTTYLNERLAKHYDVSGVVGSRFRKVQFEADSKRGGILRHASILAVTSYATRTSPTVRGNWILENILGTPAPPPPPNVPALKEKQTFGELTVRQRLAEHRRNPACAGCHRLMDPVGFALENYDAVGRWRNFDGDQTVDSIGGLPDGTVADSVASLEAGILKRPEMFVETLVEKLLIFALGRGLSSEDGPAVRRIVREASRSDYAFSDIIVGIARSVPFQMRSAKEGNRR